MHYINIFEKLEKILYSKKGGFMLHEPASKVGTDNAAAKKGKIGC